MLQIDSCDFKSLAEVTDMFRHPHARTLGVAGAQGLADLALCGRDAGARLRNVVDHYSQRRLEQLYQRLLGEHQNLVVSCTADTAKELRRTVRRVFSGRVVR